MKKVMLILLPILVLLSCNLQEHRSDYYDHIGQSFLELGNFKVGSFWVYHNDSLNINDTVNVISYQKEILDDYSDEYHYTTYTDQLYVQLKSTFFNDTIYDYLQGNYYSRHYSSWSLKNEQVTFNNLDIDIFKNKYFFNDGSTEYLYKYKLNGMSFDTVVCFSFTNSQNKLYYALNKGIISSQIIINSKMTEWNLIKFNIIK